MGRQCKAKLDVLRRQAMIIRELIECSHVFFYVGSFGKQFGFFSSGALAIR
ncbi:hypothetical protein LT85_2000 [Collimonas arenae]|uniref:Uncharacterized protein n=1 Tax=Collimonas arenae TaxID=279058 RepID=A0A0A1F8T9_9BURK|nr:hypothetical protein LT85_2000 [Collimonas arenae]